MCKQSALSLHFKVLAGHSATSLCRKLAQGLFRRVSSAIRSFLADNNNVLGVIYWLNFLDLSGIPIEPEYLAYFIIRVDEKMVLYDVFGTAHILFAVR